MPHLIMFNCIAANYMQSNAIIMIGDNVASGWDSNSKNQMSHGNISGVSNVFPANFNLINDNDLADVTIIDSNIQPQKNVQV